MAWYSILPSIIAQAAAAPEATGNELSVALRLGLAIGVIALSFLAGALIARWLKMPDYSFSIGLILFTLIAAIVVNIVGWPPKRGIDLSGGVVLIYEVDKGAQPSAIQSVIGQLNEKLNPVGAGERIEARPNAQNQIEIVAPEGVDAARVERAVKEVATDELSLESAGKRAEPRVTVWVYNLGQQRQQVDMSKLIFAVGKRINPGGVKELTIRQYGAEQLEIIVPEVEETEVEHIKRLISTSGKLEFRIVANANDDKDIIRAAAKSSARDVYIGSTLRGRWMKMGDELHLGEDSQAFIRETEGRGREVLARIDPFNIDRVRRASSGTDQQGALAVHFSLFPVDGEKFGQLTSKNLPDQATGYHRHLGIVLDGVMLSAPTINSTIHEEGIIQGTFTQGEIDFLVGILNAGSLPETLNPEPISQQRVSAQLGDDTIRQGSVSLAIATASVLLFMGIYYRFCGIVADVAVMLNMLVTVALMILIHAAFTLPGLAGLVLSVGMAVDANVLIYERMREETERGASLRMAIRNGFSRAMSTIIDSHVTTLSSGVVLYMVGTDQIKGFAVTLVIGLLLSLFTAVFVARVIFDIFERQRWLTRLNMMHLIGVTNFDFIGWRVPAIAGSVLLIIVGLAAAWQRGQGLLDIDFTGGSSVQMVLAEGKPHDIGEVRTELEGILPDVAVSSVGERNLEFKIDTSEPDIKKVQQTLQEKFGDSLQTYSMSYGEISKIEPKPPAEGAAGAPTKASASGPDLAPPADSQPPKDEQPKPSETQPAKPETEGEKDKAAPAESAPAPSEDPKSSSRAGKLQIVLASTDVDQALAALLVSQAQDPENPAPTDKGPAAEAQNPPADKPSPESPGKPDTAPPSADAPAADQTQPDAAASRVGGSRVTLTFPQKISYAALKELVGKELTELKHSDVSFELTNPKYQEGSDVPYSEWTLEIKLDGDQTKSVVETIKARLASTPVFPSSSQIGGKVAGDTQVMALYALLASLGIMVIYIWFRFENLIFGLAAVVALVHDVLIAIAFIALSYYLAPYLGFLMVDPFKISLAVVAALLTIVGYSINDKIVVFDRIREVRGKSKDLNEEMINASINQALSRTILTGGSVIVATIILYFTGGPGIHGFAYAMIIGILAGTYSSIYIAAPVLLWLKKPLVAPQKVSKSAPSGRGTPSERVSKPSGG